MNSYGITEKEGEKKGYLQRQRKGELHREIRKYIFYYHTVDVVCHAVGASVKTIEAL